MNVQSLLITIYKCHWRWKEANFRAPLLSLHFIQILSKKWGTSWQLWWTCSIPSRRPAGRQSWQCPPKAWQPSSSWSSRLTTPSRSLPLHPLSLLQLPRRHLVSRLLLLVFAIDTNAQRRGGQRPMPGQPCTGDSRLCLSQEVTTVLHWVLLPLHLDDHFNFIPLQRRRTAVSCWLWTGRLASSPPSPSWTGMEIHLTSPLLSHPHHLLQQPQLPH